MFTLAPPRKPRRPSLTPMIDIVFLLLVFFMLASQFGIERVLPLSLGGGGQSYSGPPRLITVSPEQIRLNGQIVDLDGLAEQLKPLLSDPNDVVVLQPGEGASLQHLMDVTTTLGQSGITNITVVE